MTQFVEEQQLHGEDASVLDFELEQRDLVRVARTFGGTPDVYLTDAGRAAIHRLKKLRLDRAARRPPSLHHGRLPAVAVRHRRRPEAH
ncbi:hypothetical protein [Streptomyces nigrescens]|uniref:Uncharacterized protein n=1 Tax=Streptomyces nigrescens TaxID=1920 RepID=A0ABY7ITE1_STRNI|nr:hypothetical protein [Streptomyces nigrescens]WAU02064.1 hypothetical protein STRNI_000014 [Streptomyces nigrescens]